MSHPPARCATAIAYGPSLGQCCKCLQWRGEGCIQVWRTWPQTVWKNYFSVLGFVKPYLSPRHGIWFGDSFLPSLIESFLIPWWLNLPGLTISSRLKIDRALPHRLRAARGRIFFPFRNNNGSTLWLYDADVAVTSIKICFWFPAFSSFGVLIILLSTMPTRAFFLAIFMAYFILRIHDNQSLFRISEIYKHHSFVFFGKEKICFLIWYKAKFCL